MLQLIDRFNAMFDKPDFGLLLLRVAFAGMMLFHGVHKLIAGVGGIEGMLQAQGLPAFIAYGVYVGEVIAPVLMILGILTRPSALIFSFTMIVAWLMTGPGNIAVLNPKTGAWAVEHIMVFFFAGIAILYTGAGRYALGGHRWS